MREKMDQKERFPDGFHLVLFFLKGSKQYFACSIFFACLVSLFDLLNPNIISFFVDSVIDDQPSSLPSLVNVWIAAIGGRDYLRAHLYVIGLVVTVIALLGALWRYLFRLSNTKGAETLVRRMRDTLYDQLIHLPFSWYNKNHTGDIIQRCTSDVETIKVFLSDQLTSLFRIAVMIILALGFMFSIHIRLALCAIAFIPVIVLYSFFFHKKIGSAFLHADEEEGRLSAIAQENLTGVRVVRAFGREAYERKRFETRNAAYTEMWVRLMQVMSAFFSISDLFSGLQVMTVVVLGAVYCVQGSLSAGQFIAFVSYNAMLQWPIRTLGRVISNMSKANISVERIRYIMNSEREPVNPDALRPDMKQNIVFDHVSWHYDNDTAEILDDISFEIKAGTTVGILGGTGSGKTTLMSLLDRLYDLPASLGQIRIGKTDIQNIDREYLRRNIGIVLQEPYLFSRTLSDNIRIAKQRADMDDIRNAARLAALDETIAHFEEGYDTYVGERGVTLSGGQKQRTAIAQMLIRKPPVMIFDDSLSAVDAETDAKIRQAIAENTGGSTVILIAHRITTLMNADHIIVLDHGRIAEEGTHKELLAKQGIYRKIYDLQASGLEEEENE